MKFNLLLFLTNLWVIVSLGLTEARLSATVSGLKLSIANDLFSATFSNGQASSIVVDGKNIVTNLGGKASFYIDYNNGVNTKFKPTGLKLLSKSTDMAHAVYYTNSTTGLSIEMHYIAQDKLSGLYQYVVVRNGASSTVTVGEFRMVCRFDPTRMTKINNGKIQVTPPLYGALEKMTKVQDETWKLADGSYYSKYDLADYVRETNFYGVLGGGFGAWFIHPSHEYFSGGPLKQDLIAHQDALMIVYMSGAHFGTPQLAMPRGFVKLYGPWLIYFNQGSDDRLIADVKSRAQTEIGSWPYNFIHDENYPTTRGTVKGKVSGVKAMVVLSPQGEQFDLQVTGYSYHSETSGGCYTLKNVRPGNYLLTSYAIEGASVGTVLQTKVTVSAGHTTTVDTLTITEPSNIIWQIGKADRRSSEFLHSTESRNYKWQLVPPANLTFNVHSNNEAKDWYYAQVKSGSWNVVFRDTANGKDRTLLLGIAGASRTSSGNPKLHISLNNVFLVTAGTYDNDQAIYREAMQSGNYHFEKITVSASKVVNGTNTLKLELMQGAFLYDCLVYHSA